MSWLRKKKMAEELPNMPTLPVIVAEACMQVLDKKNPEAEEYRFLREDLYRMLRDVARMGALFGWQEGRETAFSADDVENPYEKTYYDVGEEID
jgi:hypothetical protein